VVVEALEPEAMKLYAQLCGRTLAQAHARTASRPEIARYLAGDPDFGEAIADFSVAYADLNDGDHAAMLRGIKAGQIEVHDLDAVPAPTISR